MSGDFAETSSLEPSSVNENIAIADFDDFVKYITEVVNTLLPDDGQNSINFKNVVNEGQNKVSCIFCDAGRFF